MRDYKTHTHKKTTLEWRMEDRGRVWKGEVVLKPTDSAEASGKKGADKTAEEGRVN